MGKLFLRKNKDQICPDYQVADENHIDLAHFSILEYLPEKKNALVRLRFFRNPSPGQVEELLRTIFTTITRKGAVVKVSFLVEDSIPLGPFQDLGLVLEGILQDHSTDFLKIHHEYVFGAHGSRFALKKKAKLVELSGPRLTLKMSGPEDAPLYLDYYQKNKEFLAPFEPAKDESFYSLSGQEKELRLRHSDFLSGRSLTFGIFCQEELMGKIRLSNLVRGSFQSASLGYGLSKDHCGQGYMTEAVALICDYALKDLGLHRLEAATLTDNIASQKVLEANGFTRLCLVPGYLKINGQWQDHYLYQRLKEN